MMALLADALLPNLVQTTEGTPALVHTGPFGNIAHGTSSILSQKMGVRLADYVVNECGFAADLGAEKYFDIVMRASGIRPAAAVLVTSVQSLRAPGRGTPRGRTRKSGSSHTDAVCVWSTDCRRDQLVPERHIRRTRIHCGRM
jgi:formyltetrahydrofolate synthetase